MLTAGNTLRKLGARPRYNPFRPSFFTIDLARETKPCFASSDAEIIETIETIEIETIHLKTSP